MEHVQVKVTPGDGAGTPVVLSRVAARQASSRRESRDAPASESEDATLVRRAADGDATAFGSLYRTQLDSVYRYVLFQVADAQLASDLTQDVFLSAFEAIGELRSTAQFRGWLMRIAHNKVMNHRRSVSRNPPPDSLSNEWSLADPNAPSPQKLAETQLTTERVLAATRSLTALQRRAFALRFVAGLSVGETAQAMGRTPGAVRNLQFHALAALRHRLTAQER